MKKKIIDETPETEAPAAPEPVKASKCEDHAIQRARIGAGFLKCSTCGEQIPN